MGPDMEQQGREREELWRFSLEVHPLRAKLWDKQHSGTPVINVLVLFYFSNLTMSSEGTKCYTPETLK
jgi:hypothetical protein